MIETELTDKEMYHITSSLCVVFVIQLIVISIVGYAMPQYSIPTMKFIFLLIAIFLFFESSKIYYRILNMDRKLDIE